MPAAPSDSQPSASSEQDRAWVSEALTGNEGAYGQLVEKYRPALERHIRRMVRDHQQVEDLVQESFVKAFGSLESYDPSYAFSTWLYRITTNHSIDYLRKRKLATLSIDKPIETKDGELQMELPDTTYRPDRHLVRDQRNAIIAAAIEELPPKYHRVIEMRHRQELSYEEIAEELDLPLGTVKAHIFRARALLNKSLKERRSEIEINN